MFEINNYRKKKKNNSLEDSKSQKFSSNGSLLSQNGLKPTLAIEDEKAAIVKTHGGEHHQQQQHQHHGSQGGLGDESAAAPIFSISRRSVTSGDHIPASMDSRRSHIESVPHSIIDKGKSHTLDITSSVMI